jgi:hypothetical protein
VLGNFPQNVYVQSMSLVDSTSTTQVDFPAGPASVEYQFDQPQRIQQYTLTSAAQAGDPSAWTLEGSSDGLHWTVLDQRSGECFTWRQQTRAFTPAATGSYRYSRWLSTHRRPARQSTLPRSESSTIGQPSSL